ncbi:MAG TPA: ATP-binding protein [Gemmatimonadaceae bacterium]|nr:ATP-binding protein [Gemmatimonadaceae bacterium]
MIAPLVETAEDIAVLAPYGRDTDITAHVLGRWGLKVRQCRDVPALCEAIRTNVGVVMLTEEALSLRGRDDLIQELRNQRAWSDVPIVLLTSGGGLAPALSAQLASLAESSTLTVLERPVRLATLVTTLRSALRARRRQFDVRDNLVELEQNERELRENERRLREARAVAEDANEAKTRFLATMSHELRTPLNAIAGYAEIMSLGVHGPITAEQRVDLERISRSQRYLLGLINDILNYSKIESGHVAFAIHPFPVDPMLRSLEGFIAPQLAAKRLQYAYVAPDGNCKALADEEKTQQILLNLLSNAVKFTPQGGSVQVHCTTDDQNVVVAVRDTGPGIAPEKQNEIFEPFVQLGRGLTTAGEGTGLGLSISRDLARKMNGDLTVESVVGAGSTFTLTLPLG